VPTLKKKVASPLHEGAVFLILFMNFPFLLETRITFPTQRQRHLAVTVRLMLGSCHFHFDFHEETGYTQKKKKKK